MKPPQLIALDLDGTLLDARHAVSPRSAEAIRTLGARGTEVLLVTGRPPRMTRTFLEDLQLGHAIVYNGASRYDRDLDTCEHHHQMPAGEALAVIARLRARIPGVGLGIETHHGWYLDERLDAGRRANPRPLSPIPPDDVGRVETFVRDAVIKVFARHPDLEAPAMADVLAGMPVYVTWSGAGLLEIMHPAVNKRDALARYAVARDIPATDVAAFGDQHNDREMLSWAGLGVAMENAPSSVKAAADEVAPHHDEDGVAVVLERWL